MSTTLMSVVDDDVISLNDDVKRGSDDAAKSESVLSNEADIQCNVDELEEDRLNIPVSVRVPGNCSRHQLDIDEKNSTSGRRFAKDKRRLRERRRSTGIVKICQEDNVESQSCDETASGAHRDDVIAEDDETEKNTSRNELIAVETDFSTSINSSPTFGSDFDVICTSARQSMTSLMSNADESDVNHDTFDDISLRTSQLNELPITSNTINKFDILYSRLQATQQMLDESQLNNQRLKQILQIQEHRIVELESEIVALTQDLEFADEENVKLKDKNHALTRVKSTSSNV